MTNTTSTRAQAKAQAQAQAPVLCSFKKPDGSACTKTAISRGLCKTHWAWCARHAQLPPKRPRVPRVMMKLFIPRPLASVLKRYAQDNGLKLSPLINDVLRSWAIDKGFEVD
jgi:hypothetical protein